tara:strand:- start:684 stop:1322 length:639 start_codon:yes stop_codon:yes gene_type:complete
MIESELPKEISVFPLSNAIFFPRTVLPLNIFEKRYLQLVNDSMHENRLFGMIQPKVKTKKNSEIYSVGCLGKIVSFNETEDKRFIIGLSGIIRFKVLEELKTNKLYRKFRVDYSDFINDLKINKNSQKDFNKNALLEKVQVLFNKTNYYVSLDEFKKLNFDQLLSTICMVSPFSIEEKQKLVEAIKIEEKFKILDEIINFNLLSSQVNKTIQ